MCQRAERSEFYPQMLIFRMSNVCDLGCLMCNGETSSYIRKRVDRLPPIRPRYPDSLFEELRTFLHHADYVEFYGGEPFVVKEHLRIFDIMLQMRAGDRPAIYVNTNGTVLTTQIRRYLGGTAVHAHRSQPGRSECRDQRKSACRS